MGAYLPSEFPNMDSRDCFLPLRMDVIVLKLHTAG